MRSLGPPRSIATLQCRPSAFAVARTAATIFDHDSVSSCAQFTRAMSIPRATSSPISSSSSAASLGRVTMIRVDRC